MGFFSDPALGLLNEAVLEVVNAHRAKGTFAEVENLVARRRTFAGDGGHLVVAVQMVLVRPVADLFALQQLSVMFGLPAAATKVGNQSKPEKMPF